MVNINIKDIEKKPSIQILGMNSFYLYNRTRVNNFESLSVRVVKMVITDENVYKEQIKINK
ncbi:hypothetical protein C923_03460 [Plasmodium falciparum UGT5.1]|uniref:Uncharacterized protein n=1 Tax=Plasmodium falciparum UGT5.1 TaxID=1237627 RepID=W7JLU9_PLAFA|nr:hypothetical protein C923_03460 [Plasmodium falciparum UGT5.1]